MQYLTYIVKVHGNEAKEIVLTDHKQHNTLIVKSLMSDTGGHQKETHQLKYEQTSILAEFFLLNPQVHVTHPLCEREAWWTPAPLTCIKTSHPASAAVTHKHCKCLHWSIGWNINYSPFQEGRIAVQNLNKLNQRGVFLEAFATTVWLEWMWK